MYETIGYTNSSKFKISKELKLPSDLGIPPVSKLRANESCCNDAIFAPKFCGMLPDNLLFSKVKK